MRLPWIIRDMKHPRKKVGNNVSVQVRAEGLAVIRAMPHNDERIFPYHPDTVSRRFTEACKILGIEDLHFHDLRHDGISRLFEMGLQIPEVARANRPPAPADPPAIYSPEEAR